MKTGNQLLSGIKQEYGMYTQQDQLVWQSLYDRQMHILRDLAAETFINGLHEAGFSRSHIPDFDALNATLGEATGWNIVAVEGIVEDRKFFELLSQRKFPATTWLRSADQLDYLEEPDMFHDVFAHVPLLTNPAFASFLEQISAIALRYEGDKEAIGLLSKVYWYTVEFGLIRENGKLKIYGAGILSSPGESKHAVGLSPMHFDYNIEQILNTPFRKDVYQDRYFIIDSFEKLYESTGEIAGLIDEIMAKRLVFSEAMENSMLENSQDLVPSR